MEHKDKAESGKTSGPLSPLASPLSPPATGRLEGSVTMFTAKGGFDTVNDLSSISADSTLNNQCQPSKTFTRIVLHGTNTKFLGTSEKGFAKTLNQHVWEEKPLESQAWLTANYGNARKERESSHWGFMACTGYYNHIYPDFKATDKVTACEWVPR